MVIGESHDVPWSITCDSTSRAADRHLTNSPLMPKRSASLMSEPQATLVLTFVL